MDPFNRKFRGITLGVRAATSCKAKHYTEQLAAAKEGDGRNCTESARSNRFLQHQNILLIFALTRNGIIGIIINSPTNGGINRARDTHTFTSCPDGDGCSCPENGEN